MKTKTIKLRCSCKVCRNKLEATRCKDGGMTMQMFKDGHWLASLSLSERDTQRLHKLTK